MPGSKSYYGEIGSCSLDVGAKPRPPSPPPFGATEARVVYTEGGSRGGGCSCPEIDEMTIGMSAPTERPPFIVGWFGTDEAAATSARPADMIISSPTSPDGAPTSAIDVSLGESQDHERSGHAFGRTGRYCFALAWMNELGEIGERSPATCLDTRSETDPAVTVNDEGACVCRFTGKRTVSPGAVSFFALAGVVALARRFASRRRSARS